MPAPATLSPSLMRLAIQIQSLSELTESLAYRLLELEERLAVQELKLQPLLQTGSSAQNGESADTELRLEDTEERLARLEALLSGLAGSAPTALRQEAAVLPLQQNGDATFFEEGEQLFMDELPDELDCLDSELDGEPDAPYALVDEPELDPYSDRLTA
ncbi:hypothetical protein SYNGFB01_02470 [Synechococcus sp. GFB01]|nr:hypothetical protein SYNGFB01_02470 [Synechococcus sp. GFB01]